MCPYAIISTAVFLWDGYLGTTHRRLLIDRSRYLMCGPFALTSVHRQQIIYAIQFRPLVDVIASFLGRPLSWTQRATTRLVIVSVIGVWILNFAGSRCLIRSRWRNVSNENTLCACTLDASYRLVWYLLGEVINFLQCNPRASSWSIDSHTSPPVLSPIFLSLSCIQVDTSTTDCDRAPCNKFLIKKTCPWTLAI